MEETVCVIGLGYVGLPVAVAMSSKFKTFGFDINLKRVAELRSAHDRTGEVEGAALEASGLEYCSEIEAASSATIFIVTVPTPVDDAHRPDLSLMFKATAAVARVLKKGDMVIYESTVYPGVTEEECVPIIENISKLKLTRDFDVGYSPERINPGDKLHTFTKIKKVVAAQSEPALKRIAALYSEVVEAGIFEAKSIKVAEAAKVIENTQRDLNIALINELALIFDRLEISTHDVLEAARTKWNFLDFKPGLVGGHCIGVDPYYLTHKAEQVGFIPNVILAGRKINDGMGQYVAQRIIRELILSDCKVRGATVTILGLTFKENCPDIRNSKVIDIIRELQGYDIQVQIADPYADAVEVLHEYQMELTPYGKLVKADAVVLAVAHNEYSLIALKELRALSKTTPVVADVKGMLRGKNIDQKDAQIWEL